jgi:predicted GH43/DUF377 family glycosyl hydrolase
MIEFKKTTKSAVDDQTMQEVYDKIKTPYKHGAVLKFKEDMCDSPGVYRFNGKWYMSFIKIGYDVKNSGYDSHLAVSDDLVNWKYLCANLKRTGNGSWDSNQVAAYPIFVENDFNGNFNLQQVNGNYYFAYLGGALMGYETDPLSAGLCRFKDVESLETYEKLPKPILSPNDIDARVGEKSSVFKCNAFIDKAETLGYKYVNVYNARGVERRESMYLAVSNDGETWERYGKDPIVFDETENKSQRILGDGQIIKIDDLYVMIYFVWDGEKAFNTFACSYDLINWTKWQGKNLIESEFEWEDKFAHKPWLVVNNGIVYHYYCAVNSKGERFIALATSKKIK